MEKIIVTFIGINRFYSDWNKKSMCLWETDDGKQITCTIGNIINQLKLTIGEKYEITAREWIGDSRFYFPIEFRGINVPKHYVYNYKIRKLIPFGSNLEDYNRNITYNKTNKGKILDKNIFIGKYNGIYRLYNGIKYTSFLPEENEEFDYLFVTTKNKGLKKIDFDNDTDKLFMLFERSLYMYNPVINGKKVAIGEFPIIIIDIKNQKTIIFNQSSYNEVFNFKYNEKWSASEWLKWYNETIRVNKSELPTPPPRKAMN